MLKIVVIKTKLVHFCAVHKQKSGSSTGCVSFAATIQFKVMKIFVENLYLKVSWERVIAVSSHMPSFSEGIRGPCINISVKMNKKV